MNRERTPLGRRSQSQALLLPVLGRFCPAVQMRLDESGGGLPCPENWMSDDVLDVGVEDLVNPAHAAVAKFFDDLVAAGEG